MTGSPGIRLAPELPPGPRAALVIATALYQDPELRQLRAPAHDARDLAKVLGDPDIGAFTVTQVVDAEERQARRAVDVFLSGRSVGDVVVVYLSCHGVLDRRNRLYFAATDTVKTQLSSTGISAAWLRDQMEECRARQQVMILDCCFSGAFAHGSKGDADLDLERRLAMPGRGLAVLTASRASEYSFEGQALPGAAASGSVFTAGLVQGLRTGAADVGGDGYVSVDEAYDYAYRYVQASGASQTPQRWLSGGEGTIVLARSPAGIARASRNLADAERIPDSLYATNFFISYEKPNYPEPARSYATNKQNGPSGRNVLVRMRPARLFGTDGVRGIAGRDLSAPLAVDLAIAAARVLAWSDSGALRAVAVIGRDSSSSGQFLESAIIAGLTSSGVDVIRIGAAPAAAVGFLTALHGAQLGVSLSASHSRAPYNGIKFFGPGGYKLQDSVEDEIERHLISTRGHGSAVMTPAVFGTIEDGSAEIEGYISHVLSSLPGNAAKALAGLRVVVDCANGAASAIAPRLLRAAGADVTAIGVYPDGQNINIGSGATAPEAMISAVMRHKAHAGIAYDGDAEGCIAVDHLGRLIDGDQILAALALDLADQGKLANRTVVVTVMSNLGFRLAMQDAGISVVETQVGDRYLADEIRSGNYSLGGTQSGRIIMADHATGPDGLLVSLYLLAMIARSGKMVASVADVMTRYPQVLVNVDVPHEERALVASSDRLISAVEEAAVELGQRGRIVLRPSGTESVFRVMVEDDDQDRAERIAQQLANTVREPA